MNIPWWAEWKLCNCISGTSQYNLRKTKYGAFFLSFYFFVFQTSNCINISSIFLACSRFWGQNQAWSGPRVFCHIVHYPVISSFHYFVIQWNFWVHEHVHYFVFKNSNCKDCHFSRLVPKFWKKNNGSLCSLLNSFIFLLFAIQWNFWAQRPVQC